MMSSPEFIENAMDSQQNPSKPDLIMTNEQEETNHSDAHTIPERHPEDPPDIHGEESPGRLIDLTQEFCGQEGSQTIQPYDEAPSAQQQPWVPQSSEVLRKESLYSDAQPNFLEIIDAETKYKVDDEAQPEYPKNNSGSCPIMNDYQDSSGVRQSSSDSLIPTAGLHSEPQNRDSTWQHNAEETRGLGSWGWSTASSWLSKAQQVTHEPALRKIGAKLSEFIAVPDLSEDEIKEDTISSSKDGRQPSLDVFNPDEAATAKQIDPSEKRQLEVMERLHSQLMAAEDTITALRDQEARLLLEAKRSRAEVEEMRAEFQKELDESMRVANKRLIDTRNRMESRERTNELDLNELRNELKSKDTTISDLNLEVDFLTAENIRLKNDIESAATRIRKLESDLSGFEAKRDHDVQRIDQLQKQIKAIEDMLSLAESRAAMSQAELAQIASQNSCLKAQIQSIEGLRETLGAEEDIAHMIRKVQAQCQLFRDKYAGAQNQIQRDSLQIQRLVDQVASLESQLRKETNILKQEKQPESHVDPISANYDANRIAILEARLAAKSERIETLICELASQKTSIPTKRVANSLFDDGKDTLVSLYFVKPVAHIIARFVNINYARNFEESARKYQYRIGRAAIFR